MAFGMQNTVCLQTCGLISSSQRQWSSSRRNHRLRLLKALPSARFLSVVACAVSESPQEPDCNAEECAPEKEVGKVSVEWLAGEKTKVLGTFPPKKRGWTGYVEKDTAGQTNIYSVEPTVYVAESAISSGNAGQSSEGSENTVAIAGGLAFISIAAASFVLIQVSHNQPKAQMADYSGAPLSYYISKFGPQILETFDAPPANSSMETSAASEILIS